MMKTTSKVLLAGAVAALVVAISAAPSEAGRAKKKMAAATPACQPLTYCATNCANGWCTVYQCGFDGKYYQSILPPVCAQGLCVNVQRKC
ncbi:MAG TPA: hypothetical protein VNL39_10915 [Xanthobacteraceae bacterium]|nr:hypothetical protein [Xanthobacteraceae bacterium]